MNTKNMEPTTKEMLEAMGWTITCESPYEIEHIDGSTATGQSTQPVVDAIIEEYKAMKEEEARLAELNKKLESTKDLDLQKINGREIIEFLNGEEVRDELCDISICAFKFESQSIKDDIYILNFTGVYNNWGTRQDVPGNKIYISKNGVKVRVEEPFEGDGSSETVEEVLTNWLKTHSFSDDSEDRFFEIINSAKEKLGRSTFSDREHLKSIIKELSEAYTYMK